MHSETAAKNKSLNLNKKLYIRKYSYPYCIFTIRNPEQLSTLKVMSEKSNWVDLNMFLQSPHITARYYSQFNSLNMFN